MFLVEKSGKIFYDALISKGLIMLYPGHVFIRLHVRKYNEQVERNNRQKQKQKNKIKRKNEQKKKEKKQL